MLSLRRSFFLLTLIVSGWFLSVFPVYADTTSSVEIMNTSFENTPQEVYMRAEVVNILEDGEQDVDGEKQPFQKVTLEILNGDEKGKQIIVDHGKSFVVHGFKKVKKGDLVVVTKPAFAAREDIYYIVDHYRGTNLFIVITFFFVLAIIFGKKRGIMAIIGMLFSAGVIFYFMAPRILAGGNPLLISVLGGIIILIFSLYISHGFNKRTSIALASSLLTLGFAVVIDILFVSFCSLTGAGTEESFFLQTNMGSIDLKGLLLGGIIIGVLGILDDITTAQVATVEEVAKANRYLTCSELYKSGLSVGREHIASLVNTLVLAYVGASFPLILLYSASQNMPLWLLFNNNFIAEEIVRTIVGSSALIVAVPITTMLAAYFYQAKVRQN